MVSTHSIRENHVAILTRTHQALTKYGNGDKPIAVATLVLLNDTGPTLHDDIVEISGDDQGCFVTAQQFKGVVIRQARCWVV